MATITRIVSGILLGLYSRMKVFFFFKLHLHEFTTLNLWAILVFLDLWLGFVYRHTGELRFKEIFFECVPHSTPGWTARVTAGCLWTSCLWHFSPLSDHKCSFVAFLLSMRLSPSATGWGGIPSHSRMHIKCSHLNRPDSSRNKS